MDAAKLLESTFGFDGFRPGQEEIVLAVASGRDTLAIMPTGGGKSLCFQLPALLRDGVTLVISPLIALMRDQVRALQELGVSAGALTSGNSDEDNERVFTAIDDGTLKILYMAPERLARAGSLSLLRRAKVTLIAVDEAHCVSQWGHDFRPDYLTIGPLSADLGGVQVAAFTATADRETRDEIAERLFPGRDPTVFLRGFDRPNIHLSFEPKAQPRTQILSYIAQRPNQSGIVYCASRAKTEALSHAIADTGRSTLAYHAGLDPEVRRERELRFQQEDGLVVCATVAFGMGIDKPDIRFVAHVDLPKSVESYYQEIGRAGRDGAPAASYTLYGLEDLRLRRSQIDEGRADNERKQADHARLSALLAIAEAPVCRRVTLLRYFGEESEPCSSCDLCDTPPPRFDATQAVQKALSAILRTGERFGADHIIRVLRGQANDRITRLGHDQLPTFGVGRDTSHDAWRSIILQMSALDLIRSDATRGQALVTTERSRPALRGEVPILLRRATLTAKSGTRPRAPAIIREEDEPLLTALKALRRRLAEERRVPAYVIFNDRTLIDMAERKPESLDEMRAVSGVGDQKLARYGAAFLEVVTGNEAERLHPHRMKLVGQDSGDLFDRLTDIARELERGSEGTDKPLYLKPSLIAQVARRRPRSQEELSEIPGMDDKRLDRFGAAFVTAIGHGTT